VRSDDVRLIRMGLSEQLVNETPPRRRCRTARFRRSRGAHSSRRPADSSGWPDRSRRGGSPSDRTRARAPARAGWRAASRSNSCDRNRLCRSSRCAGALEQPEVGLAGPRASIPGTSCARTGARTPFARPPRWPDPRGYQRLTATMGSRWSSERITSSPLGSVYFSKAIFGMSDGAGRERRRRGGGTGAHGEGAEYEQGQKRSSHGRPF